MNISTTIYTKMHGSNVTHVGVSYSIQDFGLREGWGGGGGDFDQAWQSGGVWEYIPTQILFPEVDSGVFWIEKLTTSLSNSTKLTL